ncbi:hypothetical protein TNCV_106101 [Trichonephila clavipes]|nr:hypothetical protein TNCV_106101 [Trichonephila clavipes]
MEVLRPAKVKNLLVYGRLNLQPCDVPGLFPLIARRYANKSERVFIDIVRSSNTKAIGDRRCNFEPWSSNEDDT